MIQIGETQHYNCDGCSKSKYDDLMITIDAGNSPGIVLCHDCTRAAIKLLQEYVGEDTQ